MPHRGFFDSLLDLELLNPTRTLFVGSSLDSVVAARSLGFYGLVFTDIHETVERVQAYAVIPFLELSNTCKTTPAKWTSRWPMGKQSKTHSLNS